MARQRPFKAKAKGSASSGPKRPKRASGAKPARRLGGPKVGGRPRPYSSVAGKGAGGGPGAKRPRRTGRDETVGDEAVVEVVAHDKATAKPARARKERDGGHELGDDATAKPARVRKERDSGREPGKAERLQKVLAQAGLGSRRACEELIVQGRVTINGEVARELGTKVDPAKARVAVDGETIKLETTVYYAVNKPKGYVSTNDDPSGRPRVLDLLPEVPERVYTVGRLDEDSTGLILLTNDGELANRLAHPKYGVEKMYRALVAGLPEPETLNKLTEGVWLSDGKMRAQRVRIVGRQGQSTTLELVLAEGKKREIRRMLAKLGHKVMSLSRIAVGPVSLKGLAVGECRPLTRHEIELLHKVASGQAVSLPHFAEGEPASGQYRGRQRVRERDREPVREHNTSGPSAEHEGRGERGPAGARGRHESGRERRPEGRARGDHPRDRGPAGGNGEGEVRREYRRADGRIRDDRHRDRGPSGGNGEGEVRREYRRADGRVRDDRHRDRGPASRPHGERGPYVRNGDDRPKYPPRPDQQGPSGGRPPRRGDSQNQEQGERAESGGPRPYRRENTGGPGGRRPAGPSGHRPYRREDNDGPGARGPATGAPRAPRRENDQEQSERPQLSGGPRPSRRDNGDGPGDRRSSGPRVNAREGGDGHGDRQGPGGPRPNQARSRRPADSEGNSGSRPPRGGNGAAGSGGRTRGGSDRPAGRDGAGPRLMGDAPAPRRRIIGLEPEHVEGADRGGARKKRPEARARRLPGPVKGSKPVRRSTERKDGVDGGDS